MSRSLPTREVLVMLASVLLSGGGYAAVGQVPRTPTAPVDSKLPPQAPTGAAMAGQAETPANTPPQTHLDVAFANGTLTVNAANASLNQLLREIAQKTGMKVSGGVSEERVFGHYGPSPVSEVLTALLDGTGNNILLVDNKTGPSELVLTPRRGGATPPNPNASVAQNDSSESEPQEQYPQPTRQFPPRGRGPVASNPDGSPAVGQTIDNDMNSAPPPQEPPKTPQQIYEQLQSLGAQQPPPTTPDDQQPPQQ